MLSKCQVFIRYFYLSGGRQFLALVVFLLSIAPVYLWRLLKMESAPDIKTKKNSP